jgi:glycosyltransferase 2 family protein
MAIGLPGFWLIVYFYFKPFNKVLPFAGLVSVLVQGFQLLSFYCILYALQSDSGSFAELALVFFVSSVISALPFSIGGIGTRELAMATGAAYFHFSATKMVSASLLLFLLIVISSLAGWAISSGSAKRMQNKSGAIIQNKN